MQFKNIGTKYLVKLERGEEIISNLTKLCKEQGINSGIVSAIGGVDQVTLGWYELSSKSYHWKDFAGNLEVVSLSGNIALLENMPFLHLHMIICDENYHSFGGHLKASRVAVTLEVVIEKLDEDINRKMDQEIGLNLLDW